MDYLVTIYWLSLRQKTAVQTSKVRVVAFLLGCLYIYTVLPNVCVIYYVK